MGAIQTSNLRLDACALLPSFVVDTNESLRQRALRLVTLGCSQKILAAKMGMQASTFSRWLNQKDEIGPVSVTALDGFNAYVQELAAALDDDGGQPLAVPLEPDDEIDPVPGATRAAVRRVATGLVRLTGTSQPAGRVGKAARPARAVGEYAAAPRPAKSGARPPTRKPRR